MFPNPRNPAGAGIAEAACEYQCRYFTHIGPFGGSVIAPYPVPILMIAVIGWDGMGQPKIADVNGMAIGAPSVQKATLSGSHSTAT